jgi:hypothetical protein
MAASTPLPPITLSRATIPDFYPIAALEALVFSPEAFSQLAFGTLQNTHENLLLRSKKLASQPKEKGARNVVTKAVIRGGDGKEEIVGAAGWTFNLGKEVLADSQGKEGEGKGEEEPNEEEGGWGRGANVKLCEDVFLTAEKHIQRSTEGKNYASPNPHPPFSTIYY